MVDNKEKLIPNPNAEGEEFVPDYKKTTIVAVIIWMVLAVITAYVGKVWIFENVRELMSKLSNIFFLSGMVTLSVGILVFATSNGLFDGVGYSVSSMRNIRHQDGPIESYYEYKTRVSKKDIKSRPMFIVGGLSLLVGIIVTVVYFKLK